MKCSLENITSDWHYILTDKQLSEIRDNDLIVKKLVMQKGDVSLASKAFNSVNTPEELTKSINVLKKKLNYAKPVGYDEQGKVILSDYQKTIQRQIDNLTLALEDSKNPLINIDPYKNYSTRRVYSFTGNNEVDKSIDYKDYADEIAAYTGEGYNISNQAVRSGREDITGIVDFLNNAPENFKGGVYRGTRLTQDQVVALTNAMRKGALVQNTAPLSTSIEYGSALAFKKGDPLKGRVDTILYIQTTGHDIGKHSELPEEEEVLLKPGKYFQVLDKFETDMQIHILMEEVPESVAIKMKTNPNTDILTYLGLGLGLNQVDKGDDGKN